MKYLIQFLIIIAFSFMGELLHYCLPLPIPASIYGIVLLFMALELKWIKVKDIRETSSFLIAVMPVMFIPAAVGLIDSWSAISNAGRDYTRVVNGRNPIVAHEYLGESVEGKTVFIADDIIASGESMLEVASNLKERGAANIIANATFPLFTSGLEKFDKAVAEGKLTYVVGTNLTYRMPELLTRDWYVDVDVSKYAAYFVVALNHDMSVSSIIDPLKKIENLLASRK